MNDFDVFDMVDSYADQNEMDPAEVFKRNPVSSAIKDEAEEKDQPKKEKPKNGIDPSMVADMPEFQQSGAIYEKDEIKLTEDGKLLNIADENAKKDSSDAMADMQWKTDMIEIMKARHGVARLHIPPGPDQTRMLIAASAKTESEAQANLDEVFEGIKEAYPEMIEWKNGHDALDAEKEEFPVPDADETEENVDSNIITPEFGTSRVNTPTQEPEAPKPHLETPSNADTTKEPTKIIIDKRKAPEISWSPEEVDKIRKSRTVELNIVEGVDLTFGSIKDVDTANVDAVLSKYQRKTNDAVAALPASHYRATFTGLTYPEVIDLSTSNEMNNIDGERKKWSICFDHIKNQSIGPWEEYYLYKDPETNTQKKARTESEIPRGLPDGEIHFVSRFEDFLRKTSYMDLEFMLWKILCATAMPEEVISIECNSRTNGKECGNSYDWIYRPADLLDVEAINPAVLEEIKKTGEASTTEEIMDNYKTSPVHANNYVKLSSSGLLAVFGHISGYEYLNDVYGKIKELDNEDNNDPSVVSKAYAYTILTCIKAFIVPDPDDEGSYHRISGTENMMKVIMSLDEIDWEAVTQLTQMEIEPYQLSFSMKDIVCPKCHSRSSIQIDSISRLLFLLARSLSSTKVTLLRS